MQFNSLLLPTPWNLGDGQPGVFSHLQLENLIYEQHFSKDQIFFIPPRCFHLSYSIFFYMPAHPKQILWSLYEQRFLTWYPFSTINLSCQLPIFFQYESIYCYLYLSFHGQLNPPEFYIINWLPCFNIYWQEFDYFLVLAYNMFRFCNIPSPNNLNTNMCLFFL